MPLPVSVKPVQLAAIVFLLTWKLMSAAGPSDTAPTFVGNQPGDFNNTNTAAHQLTAAASPGELADTVPIPME